MHPVVIVLLALGYLVLAFFLAKEYQKAAAEKGFDQKKYFWLCFLFGPIGYWLVMALPDRGKQPDGKSVVYAVPLAQQRPVSPTPTATVYRPAQNAPAGSETVQGKQAYREKPAEPPQKPVPTRSLQEQLKFALQFSSDGAMINYLQKMAEQDSPKDRAQIHQILSSPPETIRDMIRSSLNARL